MLSNIPLYECQLSSRVAGPSSYQQCMGIPVAQPPCQPFVLFDIVIGMQYSLAVVLICIFLMTNDVEHFFMCRFALSIPSLVKCPCEYFGLFALL